jgi:hypothetical protein
MGILYVIFAISLAGALHAQVKLRAEPAQIIDSELKKGSTIKFDLMLDRVDELYAFEFHIRFEPDVVAEKSGDLLVNVIPGPGFKSQQHWQYLESCAYPEWYLYYACTLVGQKPDTEPITGADILIATVEITLGKRFNTIGIETNLELYDVKFLDYYLAHILIEIENNILISNRFEANTSDADSIEAILKEHAGGEMCLLLGFNNTFHLHLAILIIIGLLIKRR